MRIGPFVIASLLILAGVAMLMINQGYGSWDLLRQAAEYWPVLLIIMGIGIIYGNEIPRWLAYLLLLLMVAGVVFAFYHTGQNVVVPPWAPSAP